MPKALKPISPFNLASLLRQQKEPKLALDLFLNPNPSPSQTTASSKPFNYSLVSYDLIITKLGRARMFDDLGQILAKLKLETRFVPKEIIFCNVISYYCRARLPQKAIELFDEIPSFRSRPTIKSFNSLLNGLLICREFDKMWDMFLGVNRFAAPDACTYNIMINARGMCGDLDGAWKLFDEMRDRGITPNAVTFGTLICAMCMNSRFEEAIKFKEDMERVHQVKPSGHVYASLIKGLCDVHELALAFILKDEMLENNLKLETPIYNTLISALFKAGRRGEVGEVLEEMKRNGCKPDTATYNVMIAGFCREKDLGSALHCLHEMEKKGCKADVVTYNTLMAGLCKEGKLREATDIFEDMPRRGCKPDVLSYRILFDGLIGEMEFEEAVLLLDEMIFKGYAPHSPSLNHFLKGLCKKQDMDLLLIVLNNLMKGKMIDVNSWVTVISSFCRQDELTNLNQNVDSLVLQ